MRHRMRTALTGLALLPIIGLAACGGDTSADDETKGTADTAAAKAITAEYTGQPSAFPVSTPLTASPKGKKIAYMDCGTPICGLFFQIAEPAAAALGMDLTRIDTGQAADTVSTAFDTAVSGGFDGVFVPAIPPALWERGLDALTDAGVPVVTTGVTGGDSTKIPVMQTSDTWAKQAAKLLAAYVVAEHGADLNAVLYRTPELPFNGVLADQFETEVKALCDGCEVRVADIPAASLGNQAPSIIVDDLQAHPDTETAVFAVGEQANGLPAAMKTARLDVEMVANAPSPDTLQQMRDGDIDAALGLDLAVIGWTAIDSLARLTTGQEPDPGAVADTPPMQFLTADDLPEDISRGWTGYPDFPDRFMKLWAAAS